MEGCARTGVVRGQEVAAMRFNDGAADCQPHARTVGLGRVERIEYPIRLFGWYTWTGVADRDQQLTIRAVARFND